VAPFPYFLVRTDGGGDGPVDAVGTDDPAGLQPTVVPVASADDAVDRPRASRVTSLTVMP
jgi:hypothetical protein